MNTLKEETRAKNRAGSEKARNKKSAILIQSS